jgi:hypothetical protein
MAKGITGKLTLCDGKTGIPRTIVDIEKAAKLTVRENGKQFCNAQWKPRFPRYRLPRSRDSRVAVKPES